MNRITTTAGLLALSAVGLHAQALAPAAGSAAAQKPWSVSATLRGFYDDNYVTRGSSLKQESFGIEVSPSASYNVFTDTSAFGADYTYGMRWYENRVTDSVDHTHQANVRASHAFSPRFKADFSDSFVVAQEPQILDPQILATPLRSEGDNVRNTVNASATAGVTEKLSAVLTYQNQYYNYQDRDRSDLLDRWENTFDIKGRYQVQPKTFGFAGYRFRMVDHTSDNFLRGPLGLSAVKADARDTDSHFIYVGADQAITSTLSGSIEAGAQYTDFVNGNDSETTPYVDANLNWAYKQGSLAQIGVTHSRSQTDVALLTGSAAPTIDAETTAVYGSVNHRISQIVLSLIGQYQHSSFVGGAANDFSDDYFGLGFNVAYEINKFLEAHAGYNFDRLDSGLNSGLGADRSFSRNRVYVGIKATY